MKWILFYLLFQICLILFFWFYSKHKDKRYKTSNSSISDEFDPTQEVSIDPVSKILKRVYVNQRTGERKYVEEIEESRE